MKYKITRKSGIDWIVGSLSFANCYYLILNKDYELT